MRMETPGPVQMDATNAGVHVGIMDVGWHLLE